MAENSSDQAHRKAEEGLQKSVDKAVPAAEKLPGSFDDNPISQHVQDAADKVKSKPGDASRSGKAQE